MMKKILIILTLVSLLETGCVPAMLVGSGAAGAAIGRDSRSLQTMSDDVDIEFQSSQKLHNDRLTANGTNISVTSFNRVVLLVGQVPSEAVRARAEADVQAVPKVRRVYNLLKIAPQEGILQLGNDSSIEANVKARMTLASHLNSNNFIVVVEDKVVYLMCYTTREQTDIALNVIRNSSGVERLINLVEYKATDNVPSDKAKPVQVENAPTSQSVTYHEDAANGVVTAAVPEPLKMEPVSNN